MKRGILPSQAKRWWRARIPGATTTTHSFRSGISIFPFEPVTNPRFRREGDQMPDTLKTSHDIWVFGMKKVFKLYDCGLPLDPFQYRQAGAAPEQQQKNQIVLHCTAGFG